MNSNMSQEDDNDFENYVELEEFERLELKSVKNGFKLRDGVPFIDIVRNLSLVKNMEIREDDIFSIGYPKSGKRYNNKKTQTNYRLNHMMKRIIIF